MLNELFGTTQNEKKRNLIRIIYLTVAVILIVCAALAITLIASRGETDDCDNDKAVQSVTIEYSFSDTKVGPLLVVNSNSEAYDFELNPESKLVSLKSNIPTADGSAIYTLRRDDMLANEEALRALNEMLEDFNKQANDKQAAKNLSVWTAYRSFVAQNSLNSSVKGGHSDFHTGMLFELTVGGTQTSIKTDSTFNWIYENAHKYGFIERYPESKSSYTGVSDFDNAFRYVGTPHSTYIKENGISLEEYVDTIQKSAGLAVSGYKVSYVKANEIGSTEITHNYRVYSVSGDNMGGLIVTAK